MKPSARAGRYSSPTNVGSAMATKGRAAQPCVLHRRSIPSRRHTNLMPAYSPNVLSDEKLRQIYEYVRSVPEPPALEDIPELSGSQD